MIRRVPGINAWILKFKDIPILEKSTKLKQWTYKFCPIFDTDVVHCLYNFYYLYDIVQKSERAERYIVLFDDIYTNNAFNNQNHILLKLKFEYIDIINNIWNKFYD